MILAIASGKGGTGKTTVAVNLAATLAADGLAVQYLDCDVEEPNGHLFLKPEITAAEPVGIPVPVIDQGKCTGCGKCAEICRYRAIAMLKQPLVFAELCHGCGGCTLACPAGAIREQDRPVGMVESGSARPGTTTPAQVAFVQGRLNVGEPQAPPLIRAVTRKAATTGTVVLDAPPGTACPMVAAVRQADYVLLITEPTPFGLYDLRLAVATLRQLGLPGGVVVNRADLGDRRVHDFCSEEQLAVLLELPDDRRVAEAYSRGQLAVAAFPEWADRMRQLWKRVQVLALPERA